MAIPHDNVSNVVLHRKEEFDEFCDPDNPRIVQFKDILKANEVIKGSIEPTPCVASHFQKEFAMNLYYKLETVHHTGSFKERGALHALSVLPLDKKKRGVVIASLGNAATAMLYHARNLRIPVTVVVPTTVSPPKFRACEELGGNMFVQGANLMEANKLAKAIARETDRTYINSRDHPHLLAGHGTIGLEILEQLPEVDAVVVPVGMGGLIAGVATAIKALKPECLIYGVEPEVMPIFGMSVKEGEMLSLPARPTLADSLVTPKMGVNGFHTARNVVDKVLLCSEESIARAMLHMSEKESMVVEGGGACGLAVIMTNLAPELKLKNVVCILTGGNVDITIYPRCLERGMAAEGRLLKFTVCLKDDGPSLNELLRLLKKTGYSLNRQFQEHRWLTDDIYKMEIQLACECRDIRHAFELKYILETSYPEAVVFDTPPFNDRGTCPCVGRKYQVMWL